MAAHPSRALAQRRSRWLAVVFVLSLALVPGPAAALRARGGLRVVEAAADGADIGGTRLHYIADAAIAATSTTSLGVGAGTATVELALTPHKPPPDSPRRPPLTLAMFAEGAYQHAVANVGGNASSPCNCSCILALAVATAAIPASPSGEAITATIAFTSPAPNPDFFYLMLHQCVLAGEPGSDLDYELHLTFGGWNDGGGGEIPYQSLGLLVAHAFAYTLASMLLLVHACAHGWLFYHSWQLTPMPIKLFALALLAWGATALFLMIHWAVYAANGIGEPTIEACGRVFDVLNRLVLLGLFVLIARGWSRRAAPAVALPSPAGASSKAPAMAAAPLHHVTAPPITLCTKLSIAVAMLVLTSLYIAIAGWYLRDRDPTSTTYVYDSPPGLLVTALHLIIAVWFVVEGVLAWRRITDGNTRRYLTFLTLAFVLYWVSLPLAVAIGLSLPDYQDERVVEILQEACAAALYSYAAAALFRPSHIDTIFIAPPVTAARELQEMLMAEPAASEPTERTPLRARARAEPAAAVIGLRGEPLPRASPSLPLAAVPERRRRGGGNDSNQRRASPASTPSPDDGVHIAVASASSSSSSSEEEEAEEEEGDDSGNGHRRDRRGSGGRRVARSGSRRSTGGEELTLLASSSAAAAVVTSTTAAARPSLSIRASTAPSSAPTSASSLFATVAGSPVIVAQTAGGGIAVARTFSRSGSLVAAMLSGGGGGAAAAAGAAGGAAASPLARAVSIDALLAASPSATAPGLRSSGGGGGARRMVRASTMSPYEAAGGDTALYGATPPAGASPASTRPKTTSSLHTAGRGDGSTAASPLAGGGGGGDGGGGSGDVTAAVAAALAAGGLQRVA